MFLWRVLIGKQMPLEAMLFAVLSLLAPPARINYTCSRETESRTVNCN